MMKTVLNITAILTIVGIFIGGYIYIDKRYALYDDLTYTKEKLSLDIEALKKALI